jgi:TolB-like protein
LIDHAILIPALLLAAVAGSTAVAVACMIANVAIFAGNRWLAAGRTGRSLGRVVVRTQLVDVDTGATVA